LQVLVNGLPTSRRPVAAGWFVPAYPAYNLNSILEPMSGPNAGTNHPAATDFLGFSGELAAGPNH
jgi:hypothetical protein